MGAGTRMNVPGRAGRQLALALHREDALSHPAFEWLRDLTESSKRCVSARSTQVDLCLLTI